MAIDRKYGHLDIPGVGDDEPVFVLRAKDALAPALLEHYRMLCELNSSPDRHLDGIDASREQIEAWQAGNPTQVPRSDPRG